MLNLIDGVIQVKKQITPARVYLDITNFCFLNCKHCYASACKASDRELTLKELKNLVQQITGLGINNIIVSGGEPLSRNDIFDFLSYCADNELSITLLTNGLLIDSKKSKILRSISAEVCVSLDGVTKASHDYIRGKGNFEAVLQAINILKSSKVDKISAHFTANRLNLNEILRLPYFLNEIGMSYVVISCIKPVGRALQYPEILIDPSLMLLVRERLATIYKNRTINFRFYRDKNWDGVSCPAAHAKFGITSEGRITPCVFLGADFVGASLRDYSLEHLWNNDKMLAKLRSLPINNSCSHCSQVNDWNGGCRARAIYFNGELDAVDPYCCKLKDQKKLVSSREWTSFKMGGKIQVVHKQDGTELTGNSNGCQ